MTQTDNDKASWVGIQWRKLFSIFDRGVYALLVIMYQIFFNVSSTTILQGDTLKSFFSRIQIILGVFILFKLAINLLNVIVNPDQLGGDKSGQGFTQIVTRVIIALVMLVAVMPLNIPGEIKEGSYEAHLNANGLLFGTLYEFQDRVLERNVLAKLIIGSSLDTGEEERNNMKDAGNQLSSLVLKGFIRINLKPGETNEFESANWMCPDAEDDIKDYLADDVSPSTILDMLTHHCKTDEGERFVFTYTSLIGAIIGALFVIIIIGFTLDIAIRAIKLAILRLIAPIPIISYIDPKSAKDGAFASWTKAVISTYLDLFLRLAIVYFVMFIIQDIMVNGIVIDKAGGVVGTISIIFIFLGLLFFARQAPRFITTTLGIKSAGLGGVGMSGLLGAAGALMAGGGLAGAASGFITAGSDAATAAAQGKAAPPAYGSQRTRIAKMITGDQTTDGSFFYRRAQDAQRRMAGRRLNSLYGINTRTLADAKAKKYDLADKAATAKDLYERFSKDPQSLTSNEKRALQAMTYETIDPATGQQVTASVGGRYDSARDELIMNPDQRSKYQELLQNDMYDKQAKAGMASTAFEEMKKISDRTNLLMTPEQKHMASMKERAGNAYRAIRNPIQHHRDSTPERQSIRDRTIGNNKY